MATAGSDSDSDYGWDLSFEEDVNQLLLTAADASKSNTAVIASTVGGSPSEQSLDNEARSRSHRASAALADAVVPVITSSPVRDKPEEVCEISYPDLSRALADLSSDLSVVDKRAAKKATTNQSSNSVSNANLSPLARFRTFPRKPLSVSDLTSGAWCELQYEYTLTRLPGGKRTRTPAMKAGTKVHARLEEEVHTTVRVDVISREDIHGLKLWNLITGLRTLRETGLTRELEVWGVVDGQVVNGVIDALSYHSPDPELEEKTRVSKAAAKESPDSKRITDFFATQQTPSQGDQPDQPSHPSEQQAPRKIYITDIKTRGSYKLPTGAAVRPAKIQLFLYHRFLSDMATGHLDFQVLFDRYGLDSEAPFSDAFIAQIGSMHDEIFYDDATDTVAPSALDTNGTETNHAEQTSLTDHSGDLSQKDQKDQQNQTEQETNHIRYRNLRSLAELVQREAGLTFPDGASSLGSLVAVEYRLRPQKSQPRRLKRRGTAAVSNGESGSAEGSSDDSEYMDVDEDEDAGRCIGTNVIPVDSAILDRYLEKYLTWWRGERAATGVDIEEASLKCGYCEFAASCDWRQALDDERVRRVREKFATFATAKPTG